MNDTSYPSGWFPIATSKELKKKPVRKETCGKAVVLYRTKDGSPACLYDRCPHRSAPLSSGRVVDGDIECPYHGWRFNGEGRCTLIPFHEGELPSRFAPTIPVREKHGLIFAHHGNTDDEIYTPFWVGEGKTMRRIIPTVAKTNLLSVMENILDTTHTAFTHKNLMRGMTGKHQDVNIALSENDGMLQLILTGEKQQDGLISKLTESNRTGSTTNILAPGIVEAVYWHNEKINIVTTVFLSPVSEDETRGFIVLTTNKNHGLAYLKAAVFLPIFNKIIRQDQDILGASHANWKSFGSPKNAVSPLDYMRPNLEALLQRQEPPAAKEPLSFVLKI